MGPPPFPSKRAALKLELLRRFILDLGSVEEGAEYSIPDSLLLHSLDPTRAPFDPGGRGGGGAHFTPGEFLPPASASAFLEPRLITNPLLSTCPPDTLPTNLCGPPVHSTDYAGLLLPFSL